MKKFLILGLGFLFCSLTSASELQATTAEPTRHNIVFDMATLHETYSVTQEATQDLAIQQTASINEAVPTYVASVALIDLSLFYRPVEYESGLQLGFLSKFLQECSLPSNRWCYKKLNNIQNRFGSGLG